MDLTTPITGGCYCGKVRFRASGPPLYQANCHCGNCRRAAGAQAVAWITVKPAEFAWEKGEPQRYQTETGACRTFCGTCGTSLTYENAERPNEIDITTGSLDDPEQFPPNRDVFPEEKLSWVPLVAPGEREWTSAKMTTQRLEIGDGFHLSPIGAADKAAYLKHFADPEIGRMLLALPVPYTEADADQWIAHRLSNARKHEIQFGIRAADGFLIGGIGLVEERSTAVYRGEVGYWLAREYRGRGLMPRAIYVFAEYAFRELQLHKLTATTTPFNPSSSRALEKAGFIFEGRLRKHLRSRKGDEYFDALVYGLLSSG